MEKIDRLANRLAPHYSRFDVSKRLLFSGHSHQAWPDIAFEGLVDSYRTAAEQVDKKWDKAFEKAEILRDYLRNYYDDPDGLYCLAENTHLLLVSWLSSFDLAEKPKVVTTDGEFHSMYRQLRRLAEEGLEVEMVNAESESVAREVEHAIDDRTAAVMLSRVYFKSGLINSDIPEIAAIARNRGVPLLIDDYHGTNVVPLSIRDQNLEDCYLLVGGYKYLQWGEGNCFLRFPADCGLRPAITGWFAAFSKLDEPRNESEAVPYDDGNQRFATGTYDPASQFRAARVARFFREQELTPDRLNEQYRRQVGLLRELFVEQDLDPSFITLYHNKKLEQNGGFLALRSSHARALRAMLLDRGVYTDARGEILRMGPAPYITSAQIEEAIGKLAVCVHELT